jgi:hypothetical protein
MQNNNCVCPGSPPNKLNAWQGKGDSERQTWWQGTPAPEKQISSFSPGPARPSSFAHPRLGGATESVSVSEFLGLNKLFNFEKMTVARIQETLAIQDGRTHTAEWQLHKPPTARFIAPPSCLTTYRACAASLPTGQKRGSALLRRTLAGRPTPLRARAA